MTKHKNTEFKEFYSEEADVYQETRYGTVYGTIFKKLHHAILTNLLDPVRQTDSVLEVACGTGHTSSLLSDLGIQSIACDLTPAMMNHAKQRLSSKTVIPSFLEANAKSLPFPDNSFDWLISTRFLHLFTYPEQVEIINEMKRVLKPNGKIIIDFDNWSSRWIFSIPYIIYNLLRYKRIAPYSIYNKIGKTEKMFEQLNIEVDSIIGVGGTYIFIPGLFSKSLAHFFGVLNQKSPFRILAEQFIISGHKL